MVDERSNLEVTTRHPIGTTVYIHLDPANIDPDELFDMVERAVKKAAYMLEGRAEQHGTPTHQKHLTLAVLLAQEVDCELGPACPRAGGL